MGMIPGAFLVESEQGTVEDVVIPQGSTCGGTCGGSCGGTCGGSCGA